MSPGKSELVLAYAKQHNIPIIHLRLRKVPSSIEEMTDFFLYKWIKVLKKLNLANGEKDLSFGRRSIKKKMKAHVAKHGYPQS